MRQAKQNRKLNVHFEPETIERLTQLAKRKGWINDKGCAVGKPSMQATVSHVVQAGIEALEK